MRGFQPAARLPRSPGTATLQPKNTMKRGCQGSHCGRDRVRRGGRSSRATICIGKNCSHLLPGSGGSPALSRNSNTWTGSPCADAATSSGAPDQVADSGEIEGTGMTLLAKGTAGFFLPTIASFHRFIAGECLGCFNGGHHPFNENQGSLQDVSDVSLAWSEA